MTTSRGLPVVGVSRAARQPIRQSGETQVSRKYKGADHAIHARRAAGERVGGGAHLQRNAGLTSLKDGGGRWGRGECRGGSVWRGSMRTVQRRKGCTLLLSWSLCCCGGRSGSTGWCWVAAGDGEAAGDEAAADEVAGDEAAARCRASHSSLSCDSSKLGLAAAAAAGAVP